MLLYTHLFRSGPELNDDVLLLVMQYLSVKDRIRVERGTHTYILYHSKTLEGVERGTHTYILYHSKTLEGVERGIHTYIHSVSQ